MSAPPAPAPPSFADMKGVSQQRLNAPGKRDGDYLFGAGNQPQAKKGPCTQPGCTRISDMSDYCLQHYYYHQSLRIEADNAAQKTQAAARTKDEAKEAKDKSIRITEELFATEKTYLKGLKTVVRAFITYLQTMDQLGTPLLSGDQIRKIFQNLPDIYSLHSRMYADLKKLRQTPLPPPAGAPALPPGESLPCGGYPAMLNKLGATLMMYCNFFKMYTIYCNEYEAALKLLSDLRKDNDKLGAFMALHEKVEKCDIASLMITPIQRIPRYLLLLTELLKNMDTKADANAVLDLEHALEQIKKVALEINENMHNKERRLKVADLDKRLSRDGQWESFQLVTPHRLHVKEGVLAKKYNSKKSGIFGAYKDYNFVLFNDCLIYTSVPSGPTSRVTLHGVLDFTTCKLQIVNAPDESKRKYGFELLTNVKSFKVCAADEKDKTEWLAAITKSASQAVTNARSLLASEHPVVSPPQSPPALGAGSGPTSPQPLTPGSGPGPAVPPSPTGHSIVTIATNGSAPPSPAHHTHTLSTASPPSPAGGGPGVPRPPPGAAPPSASVAQPQAKRPAPAPPATALTPKPPGGPPPPGQAMVKPAGAAAAAAPEAAPALPARPKKK